MSAAPANPQKIRVMVVEDQPQILKNQLKILQEAPDLEVIGTALSGEAALAFLEKKQPDVLLEDLGLPGMTGIEVTREVKKKWPKIEVLIFTIFDEEEKVIEAVKAGASGYLLKGATSEKIIEAIKEVHAGGSVIQPNLARRLLRYFHVSETPDDKAETPQQRAMREEPPTRPLTEREIEILRLILDDHHADLLGIGGRGAHACSSPAWTVSSMRVPLPGADLTPTRPDTLRARSRMLARP